ncbi:MAG: hypothetical protein JSV00_06930, partial [bacterium]
MPVFNYPKKEVNVKIVYYGPGLSGKTTNLQAIHDGIRPEYKGKLVSLATQTDRTLFFDFMPLELGSLAGFRVRLHLYTVPGQVHYNATRKLVLKGVDGVVFVADSQREMADANIESFLNLEKNLQSYGKDIKDLPHIIQANKRDLEDILTVEELGASLNRYGAPLMEATASESTGVLETLTEIVRMVMRNLKAQFAETGVTRKEQSRPAREATVTEVPASGTRAAAPEPGAAAEPAVAPRGIEEETPAQETIGEESPEPGTADLPVEAVHEPAPVPPAPPRTQPEAAAPREQETEITPPGQEAVRPLRLAFPVEGVGTIELDLTIRARLLEAGSDRVIHVDVSKTLPTPSQAPEPDLPTTPDAPVQPQVSPEDLEVTVGGGFSGEELPLSDPDPVVDETVEEAGEEEQAGP